MSRTLVPILAALALAVTGCGDDTGGDECVDLSGEGETFTVRMADFEFQPSCFTASASQSVELVNEDEAIHSFTLQDTAVNVEIPGGETVEGAPVSGVVEPGTYDLVCTFHPEMTGEVTVAE